MVDILVAGNPVPGTPAADTNPCRSPPADNLEGEEHQLEVDSDYSNSCFCVT